MKVFVIFTNHFRDHDEFGAEIAAGCVEAETSHEEHDAVDAVDSLRRRELACGKERRRASTTHEWRGTVHVVTRDTNLTV